MVVKVEQDNHSSGKDVVVIRFINPPVNAVGGEACSKLAAAVREARKPGVRAIILAGGDGLPFSGGADIREFHRLGEVSSGSGVDDLDALIRELETSRIAVVAAIGGVAFGGGLELALGCHYRVATGSAKLGLPEVKLGLIPGAGGTQRLPRLVGLERAFEMIVTGNPVDAKTAMKLGLVDAVVPEGGGVVEGAVAFVRERLKAGNLPLRKVRDMQVPDSASLKAKGPTELIRLAGKKVKMSPPNRGGEAQAACARVVPAAALMDMDQGLALEKEVFLNLVLNSTQSAALRYAFFAERQTTRGHGSARPLPIRRVGVIGGGTTGSGIVASYLMIGVEVVLVEANAEALQRASNTVRGIFASFVRRGQLSMDKAAATERRFKGTTSLDDLKDVDLVVEAIFEELKLKQDVFSRLDKICPPRTILATNTSSLDVDKIASATSRPEQVVGQHFFSPTHIMRLVELVRGSATSDSTVATIAAVSKAMKKVCVVVGNSPERDGFVGNRMLFSFATEVERLMVEGASPYHIDRVLYDFGFPLGPNAVSDLAGLDIPWKIRKARRLAGLNVGPPTLGDRLCEMGRYGQKTEKGWYVYKKEKGRTPIPDPEIIAFLEQERKAKGVTPRTDISDQEIMERCMYALANEGLKILGEKIARTPEDVDVIWLLGYGYPRWKGGPMYWAKNEVGLEALLQGIEKYQRKFPDQKHWEPAPLLKAEVKGANRSRL